MTSVSFSSYYYDFFATEQAASSDSFSCSLLGEASSSLTKRADFCFHCFFLVIGATHTVSGLDTVSVGVFSLSCP